MTKFPEVSLAWLLTGEGQMFVDEKLCGVQIPFYQVDVESHITRLDELAPRSGDGDSPTDRLRPGYAV